MRLLNQLVNTDSRELMNICISIVNNIEDEADLIAPLWRSLNQVKLPEDEAIVKQIVTRLLDLSMLEEGIDELQKQPGFRPGFVTQKLRRDVYPFKEAHNSDSNLVTLLAWAEKVDAMPTEPNVFFKAKSENKEAWMTVEQDSKHKTLSIRLYPLGVVLTWLPLVSAPIALLILSITSGWQDFIRTYFPLINTSWFYLAFYMILGPTTILLVGIIMEFLEDTNWALADSWSSDAVNAVNSPVSRSMGANAIVWYADRPTEFLNSDGAYYWDSDGILFSLILIFPLAFLSLLWQLLLANTVLPMQIITNILLCLLFFWLPATRLFQKRRKLLIRKPNPFIGIYEDPRSLVWIRPRVDRGTG